MRYSSFKIVNFKGIRNITLNLEENPKFKAITLVGLNESGKTTILEAINFTQNDVPQVESHNLIPRNKQENFNETISVRGYVKLEKNDESAIKEFARKELNLILTKDIESFYLEKQYVYKKSELVEPKNLWSIRLLGRKARKDSREKILDAKSKEWQEIISFIKKSILPPIIYYPNFLADFPARIYLESREGEDKQQPMYRMVIQDILDSIGSNLKLEEHILNRIKKKTPADISALEATLERMGAKITKDILGGWEAIFGSTRGKRIVVKHGIESRGDGSDQVPYIEIKLLDGAEPYEIRERSLGFRWFFSFFIFTLYRKSRGIDVGEILFLIDEPASNLHSTAQAKLLETLNKLTLKSKLIYATHSHHLINQDWLENVFIVQNKGLKYDEDYNYDISKTDVDAVPYRKFVASYPKQQTYFQPILDKLDYQPSKLEMVPDITIVEGKFDFYTFKYINEVVLSKKYPKLNFYPGNGAGGNSNIIRLYLSWAQNFNILMDSDTAGSEAKNKYEKEFEYLVSGRVITLGDIDKSLLKISTEGLFSDEEKMSIIKSIFDGQSVYSKIKFNQAIQNLLFLRRDIKLSSETLAKFNKIFRFIQENLDSKIKKKP